MKKYRKHYKIVEVQEPTILEEIKIQSANDCFNLAKDIYKDLDTFREHFILVGLDRSNNVLFTEILSSGGLHGTVVDIRIMAKYLIESLSCGAILIHNHPSGNLKSSIGDDNITKKAKDGLKILDIMVLDHLIINDSGSYYSYADDGRL